jgi:glycerate dehydrogenase
MLISLYFAKCLWMFVMRAVFLDQLTFSQQVSFSSIEGEVTELISYPTTTPEQVLPRCEHANIIISNKVVINADILASLPHLKLICIAATGVNNVDLRAAKNLGIVVTNVSGYARQSVAQYVMAQILAYYNQTGHHNNNTKKGLWQSSDTFCVHGNGFEEVAGKTLGIIGYGTLGKAVSQLAQAFEMEVLIAERPNESVLRENRHSFNDVLQQADIISLHCPQTPATEQLINHETLALMKPTAMLINTARGALVNNEALLKALQSKQIAFTVLDVLDQEPPSSDHILIKHLKNDEFDNLRITAHIAWASNEAQQRLLNIIAKNIRTFKKGEAFNRVD